MVVEPGKRGAALFIGCGVRNVAHREPQRRDQVRELGIYLPWRVSFHCEHPVSSWPVGGTTRETGSEPSPPIRRATRLASPRTTTRWEHCPYPDELFNPNSRRGVPVLIVKEERRTERFSFLCRSRLNVHSLKFPALGTDSETVPVSENSTTKSRTSSRIRRRSRKLRSTSTT